MTLSLEDQADIIKRWYDNPMGRAGEIAEGICSNNSANRLCPFPKYPGAGFRMRCVIYTLSLDPTISDVEFAAQYGCARETAARARMYLKGGATKDKLKKPAVNLSESVATIAVPFPAPALPTKTQQLVAEKGKVYGHPLDGFRRIALGQSVIAHCKDAEVGIALNMIWHKIVRLIETPDHVDTINDIAGYAETIHMIHAERKRRK